MTSEHVIGTIDDFPEDTGTEVEVDGLQIAVFNVNGEFYAISGVCPHKGAPMALAGAKKQGAERLSDAVRGRIDEGDASVSCPWHGLEFDLETGNCPATRYRVRRFEINVEDGEVTLLL